MQFTPTVRILFLSLLACLYGACTPDAPTDTGETSPPNIVIILADDQGWGDLSMNGNPVVNTSHIDSLGRNGLIFDRFYVDPVCSPTRAALLTGRYAVRGGVYSTSAGGERLDLDEQTFARHLQNAGYRTGAFGKWHNGMQAPYHPNSRGFEEFYGYCSGHWGSYFDAMLEHNGAIVQSEGYLTDVLTERAMDFMQEHRDESFLVYLPLNTPHSPMQVPDRWWQKFADMELPAHRFQDQENPDHTRAAYAMAENIDWNVGRVADKLAELGIDERTILIYFSDNGPNGWRWNGGMAGIKGHTNEGGVRSPFVLYWPEKVPQGRVVRQITSVADLYPTLLDLTAVADPGDKATDGLSLQPLILGDTTAWPDRVLVNHWGNRTSVRSQQYRLDHEDRLFDMISDPGQTTDIGDKVPAVKAVLKKKKDIWREEVWSELPEEDLRSFTIGHPDAVYDQLPARDGIAHGNIERSNRWPNCSFYTNWTSPEDSISWEVEVLADGEFEATLYYTCREGDTGAVIALQTGMEVATVKIDEAYDPPLRGIEHDRYIRGESYVKDFKPIALGTISLQKGKQTLSLKALEIPGEMAVDFRLLLLKRL
ncbi:arylsulfatase [Flavilitoribacter nigricans]|uniref:N-acetylgalactosamine 6-sulfate sulfatase n=1 Tax=Flavilitoribacter nigricans (strain ATCC 23147 / DSM 23189 / NBRC 102662 / NCIMB 1420 / SS-2) TaxID=1122177 RepID=A0A2D0N6P5_FLAN2|nr:arylsulfatase [Flavilitoribacter nigricans]PHN04191.1 N-acetylgalactosamine 6-sulfate sulfatase [Flavilitoribacter nigricans DSM 23189 = NBRC 102662]